MSPEAAVVNTVNLFHLSVDSRDWAAARSCLADLVRVSPDAGAGQELPAEPFLGMIRSNVESFSTTQHLVSGHHVNFDTEATARCRASYQNHHVWGSGRWVLAGQQEVMLSRAPDGWRITAVTLSPAWEEGTRPSSSR
jgi:hypothetical protein